MPSPPGMHRFGSTGSGRHGSKLVFAVPVGSGAEEMCTGRGLGCQVPPECTVALRPTLLEARGRPGGKRLTEQPPTERPLPRSRPPPQLRPRQGPRSLPTTKKRRAGKLPRFQSPRKRPKRQRAKRPKPRRKTALNRPFPVLCLRPRRLRCACVTPIRPQGNSPPAASPC